MGIFGDGSNQLPEIGRRQMTVRAMIKKGDLRKMAEIAKQEGVQIEVEINGQLIRIAANDDAENALARRGIVRL